MECAPTAVWMVEWASFPVFTYFWYVLAVRMQRAQVDSASATLEPAHWDGSAEGRADGEEAGATMPEETMSETTV